MNDKTMNLLLTIAAIGLVVYGIYSMTTKKDSDTKKEEKETKIEFNYEEELDLIDNLVLDEDFKFNNELKLQIASSNIRNKDLKETSSSFSDIKYYEFSGYYIKEGKFKELLNDLFGKGNYKLQSFYANDSYYLYNKNDKCFYVFTSTLVTNCASNSDVETNCIDEVENYCYPDYSQDENNILVDVTCTDGRQYIKENPNSIKNKYSYKYVYDYDEKEKDYYISDIKLIKE